MAGVAGAGAIAQGIGAIGASKKRKKAEAAYEAEVAKQKPDEGIMDVYNKAYARYNPNAYQSAFYNQQKQNVLGQQATGISALQDRRSALAGIPSITQASNKALQSAGVAAEQQQAQQLSQLSSAAGAAASQKQRISDLKLGILGRKAAAAAERQNQLTQGAINTGMSALTMGLGAKSPSTKTETETKKVDFSGGAGESQYRLNRLRNNPYGEDTNTYNA